MLDGADFHTALTAVGTVRHLGVGAVWHLAPFGTWRRLALGAVWHLAPFGTWRPSATGDRVPKPITANHYAKAHPAISPDAKWLAYVSDEGAAPQVVVRPFPGWASDGCCSRERISRSGSSRGQA